jgi:hypothetical protein
VVEHVPVLARGALADHVVAGGTDSIQRVLVD